MWVAFWRWVGNNNNNFGTLDGICGCAAVVHFCVLPVIASASTSAWVSATASASASVPVSVSAAPLAFMCVRATQLQRRVVGGGKREVWCKIQEWSSAKKAKAIAAADDDEDNVWG